MYKRKSTLLIMALMLFASHMDIAARESSVSKFWNGVGVAAAVVAAGVGAAKLVEWCCSETNPQLISRGDSEYRKALRYTDLMEMVERVYHVQAYPFCCYEIGIMDRTNEQLLYELSTILFNRGVSQTGYVYDVCQSKKQLTSLVHNLRNRINEARGKYLSYQEVRDLQDMKNLCENVDRLLPRISYFAEYLSDHNNYFRLYESESRLLKYYDSELRIAYNRPCLYDAVYQLRKEVMWRHLGNRYPLTIFVTQLHAEISTLKSYARAATRYVERTGYAWALVDSLEWIHSVVMSDERYSNELYHAEQERLERLRLEAMHERVHAEHDKIQAKHERRQAKHEREVAQRERKKAECEREAAQHERELVRQAARCEVKQESECVFNHRAHQVQKDIAGFDHCCGI